MNVRKTLRALGATAVAAAALLAMAPTPAHAEGYLGPIGLNKVGDCKFFLIESHAKHLYWSARIDNSGYKNGMITATSSAAGPWEKFKICKLGALTHSIMSDETNTYVTAEWDYTGADAGMLRARSTTVGNWEKFQFECDNIVKILCKIVAIDNYKYVSAEYDYAGGGYGMVRARTWPDSVGSWEEFDVYPY
ncbi:fascin domain-containing protein [Catellatospora citrea]|uniref:Glycosyl hydrolase family 43 n=1 Tax=Catellatospora citrea TaxID=53366 RepID=A0A8J3K982_9ACTN|nr:hypothetical protein [Catellatospora citrea]RKE10544.1 hypothetical protein C8E86_5455 [Catellatospora citrea]GIF98792.1 hypothetical protein Cci01nite_38860 [Catellatospora citrea]